jgi:predicted ATPase
MDKIIEAQSILKDLGLPLTQQNKVSALTFLALCGIGPNDDWKNAKRISLTLSKGIMSFSNEKYNQDYKQNTRESFRKDAITPFIEQQIIDLNPDNPDLAPQSSNTHYAIKPLIIETLKSFGTDNWDESIEKFKEYQFKENISQRALIKRIVIENYKSINKMEIELGRFNVFIGANGSGKSNILEAIAMVGASKGNDLDNLGLMSRGIRIAKPLLTLSSFLGKQTKKSIDIQMDIIYNNEAAEIQSSFQSSNVNDIYAKWIDLKEEEKTPELILSYLAEISGEHEKLTGGELINRLNQKLESVGVQNKSKYSKLLSDFAIFNLSTQTLRGLSSNSAKLPLGINGEGLDVLISNFNSYETSKLLKCKLFFNWLEQIGIDRKDELKLSGYKLGKSSSTLYFHDRHMQKKNNLFSAENANEGILHVIFYLALFISNKTPDFLAIDNVETALNPKLCRSLIKELVELSKERGKQAIITTHNPAVLDGLNLNDDDQRLFEIYRTDEGLTQCRRIKFKKGSDQKKFKLSEMWTEGLLGGVPQNF